MSRLAPLDKALVLVLVPLWVVAFALAVRTQLVGGGQAWIGLSLADAESYPVLNGEFSPDMHASSPLQQAGLQAGDSLLRAGAADLRGVGNLALGNIVIQERGPDLDLPVVYERNGERHETTLRLTPVSQFLPMLGVSFSFAASALFLGLRARPTRSVRAYFLAAFSFAIAACFFEPIYAMAVIFPFAAGLQNPLMLRFAQVFPDDVAPEGRWQHFWPWLFTAPGLLMVPYFGGRYMLATVGAVGTMSLGGAMVLAVFTRKYRRLDPVARRQVKWVLLGAYGAFVPSAVVFAITSLEPRLMPLVYSVAWAMPILPAALVVSIVRFNLFDVDRLLSAAASYNVVLVVLGAGALIVVPRVAEATSALVGIDPGTGQIALSLLLVAVVIPAHRRLRPQIDRLFFKERYALDHGIAELLPTLSSCADARELTERVGKGLYRLLRPEACVVYAAVEESYAPVYVEGRAVPPAFADGSSLIVALQGRRAPLALGAAGRRPDEAPLGPFDRAALETLEAEVVVPVQQDDALAAFVCLGPKRSGDVYTSTDLSILTAVAETVSLELRRFDQEETVREAREMQDSLRRYVPGAIAEQLSSGGELASGECEVSVLFVDLRGYTSFSEGRAAAEIFSTVNRYTETVSEIVRKHGGSVVEFNGDGMMAVFGAPRELSHKERAAVEAGREIVAAVDALPVASPPQGREAAAQRGEAERSREGRLSVGVGIATGEAFVGNIQAVDRMIWSAIGNTTNLAARLQGVTRELDASVVIEAATWERAQPEAADFEQRCDVPIRGRRDTQDVYVLPTDPGS